MELHALRGPTERAAIARVTPCPCLLLWNHDEEVVQGSIMLRGVLALRSCWHAWQRSPLTRIGEGLLVGDATAAVAQRPGPLPYTPEP